MVLTFSKFYTCTRYPGTHVPGESPGLLTTLPPCSIHGIFNPGYSALVLPGHPGTRAHVPQGTGN
eukprot:3441054-Rhodomonas_salina.1